PGRVPPRADAAVERRAGGGGRVFAWGARGGGGGGGGARARGGEGPAAALRGGAAADQLVLDGADRAGGGDPEADRVRPGWARAVADGAVARAGAGGWAVGAGA